MVLGTEVRDSTLLLLVAWRLSSVFIVQTAHVPDEYWQSLEVAHKLAFDYGHLTWEWHAGIRSYLYPFLISVLYQILSVLNIDFVPFLVTLPRIFQALLSAYADYRFYVWTGSKFALFSLCTNAYWYYCCSRTLINSVETCLTIIALSFFPWRESLGRSIKFLWIIGLLCAMRPTAVIIWLPLFVYHFFKTSRLSNRILLVFRYLAVGLICIFVTTMVDYLCYGRVIFTPWEFFKINVLTNTADTYGVMPWYWYLTYGMRVIFGLQTFVLPVAVYRAFKVKRYANHSIIMCAVIIWTLLIYSLLPHKEFRFILPLLPMLIYIVSTNIFHSDFKVSELKRKLILFSLIISNLLPGLYISIIHQRGTIDTMNTLRTELKNIKSSDINFVFLTPCHSFPLYSHLHSNVTLRFLTCEPNLNGTEYYVDEADEFFEFPVKWLEENYNKNLTRVPSHLIVFDTIVPQITDFLKHYKPLVRFFYAHFYEKNYGKYIVIYKRNNPR